MAIGIAPVHRQDLSSRIRPRPLERLRPRWWRHIWADGHREATFRAPSLLVGLGLDMATGLKDDLTASEFYILAISGFLTVAPGVRNPMRLNQKLQEIGLDPSTSIRIVHGDELDELPVHLASDEFRALWSRLAERLTSRRGWLPIEALEDCLERLRGLPNQKLELMSEEIVDLTLLMQTGIAREHDILILSG